MLLKNKPTKYFSNYRIIPFILLMIVLMIGFFWEFNNRDEKVFLSNFETIQKGDLVLRCGRSIESYVVYNVDSNQDFSHIGIIAMENGIPYVIHAVPEYDNFLKKEKLKDFLNPKNCSDFAIFRGQFSEDALVKVVDAAEIFYKNKYTFDNEYDLKTDTKLYCTELIVKAFKHADIHLNISPKEFDFIVGKHPIILPSEFTKPPFYKVEIH